VSPERLHAQLLTTRAARSPLEVTRRLLAIQAQDPRGARLAIRARSVGLTAADVDRALTDERTVIVTWLNRGTLHLVASEDYPWLQALTTPPLFSTNARRLAQDGVSADAAERGVAVIVQALAQDGPLDREQLRLRLAAAGVRTEGQALVHLLMLASLRGLIVRGPIVAGRHAFVLVTNWLGPIAPVDREHALAELARRYLTAHTPATDRDLARWAGLALRDVRAGLRAIAAELAPRADGLLALRGADAAPPHLPAPMLLGPFEPLLLGWVSREWLLDDHAKLITRNGIFHRFALVRGRAVARWRLRGGAVALEPFADLDAEDDATLAADAEDVLRFLGAARA
jgi:hypothetical protein